MTRTLAVVFDMDGVLVETEDIWREVREEFAAGIGNVWSTARRPGQHQGLGSGA